MIRHLRAAHQPTLDRLDARLLLAAHPTASLAGGVLTVRGTAAADVLNVAVESGTVSVEGTGLDKSFSVARVRRIVVLGGRGNDTITVNNGSIPTRIQGGPGHNIITNLATTPPQVTVAATIATPVAVGTGVALAPSVPVMTTAPSVAAPPTTAASVQRIIDLTNAHRVAAGLAPLTANASLMGAATIQSTNMARLNIMSHTLPGTNAPTLLDRAALVGYQYRMIGENIAYNYPDADSVVAAWIASPEHRANILNPSFTQIGVALAFNAAGEPYFTQEFGEPV